MLEQWLDRFAAFMWGPPLVALLVGGGLFFLIFSRALPYRHFGHALGILSGRYDDSRDPGTLSHFQALSTALSGTLGLGNIAGVAVAITMGGPGAIFWMWLTAVVGVATKFYTASLAIMYRGRDSRGDLQGGPMYVIREGLGRRWWPLAAFFAVAGLFGTLPVFQVNQLVQMLRDSVAYPLGWATPDQHLHFDLVAGVAVAALVLAVILGNVQRVGQVTARLVPAMVAFYLVMTAGVLVQYAAEVPAALTLIVTDAFTGQAAAGGAVGTVIMMGIRRGAFSNEAGIGTESMAHGAARTREPVREGLVAMMGPVIDTLIVCTCTALAILVTGAWHAHGDLDGVSLTAQAFATAYPSIGQWLLTVMVICLSLSTVMTFWYYGSKCLGFLIGAERQHWYIWLYTLLIVLGSVVSLRAIIGFLDGMYAAMAIPTMVSALLLAPKVNRATRRYFAQRIATAQRS
ncbi:alanine/glycine:cation symporter family protein [Marinimicrobium alkaliphilum]|uniref:alanine/glycine:cation symporter family protein n=1 Tax=Marinimicrobium alkaliphilum TaxID=2202654 RepID=UPI000DB91314|nr:amino acid carrier protein [Marinimicrobium alkaliphilum]